MSDDDWKTVARALFNARVDFKKIEEKDLWEKAAAEAMWRLVCKHVMVHCTVGYSQFCALSGFEP